MKDVAAKNPSEESTSRELRQLMAEYQAGSLEAFERLYALLAPPLRRWLARQRLSLGAELEDLVQETFLQLHRSRHTYRPGLPVEPWAWAIARHVYLMDRRSRSRKQAREVHEAAAAGSRRERLAARASERPDETAARRELIEKALGETTERRRTSLLLHHLWGFDFREIGRMLGVSADAAKRRSSRGASDVRERTDRRGEGER